MIADRSLLALSTLLSRAPENRRSSFFKHLPESILLETERTHNKPIADISLKEMLSNIDESWYLETLRSFSKTDLLFYLSLFSEKKMQVLGQKLGIDGPFYQLPKPLELYSLNLLFNELFPNDRPLPLSYLPDSPLSFLCIAKSEKIQKLIFFLGLFDLSMELKSVLKGSILKQIEAALFPDEITFCREILEFRHHVSLGPIGLSHWNEDSEMLRQVIFERGVYRLNIGLSEASSDFVWYIHHSLNKEVAMKIVTLPKTNIDRKVIDTILEQIQTAWKGVCTVLN